MKYRLLRMSRLNSTRVSASLPAISVRLPVVRSGPAVFSVVSVGPVVFGGDRDEGLLKAETADLDLAWPVARVEDRVQRRVGVAGLDLHDVVPDLEVHQSAQAEQ